MRALVWSRFGFLLGTACTGGSTPGAGGSTSVSMTAGTGGLVTTASGAGSTGSSPGLGGHGAGGAPNDAPAAGAGAAGATPSSGGNGAGSGGDTGSGGNGGATSLGNGGGSGAGDGGASSNGGATSGGTNTGDAGNGGTSSGGTSSSGAGGTLCDVGVDDDNPPEVLDLSGNTFAHDPTMVEANGTFYRFWTGNDIPMATSTDLLDWEDGPAVYQGGYPTWVSTWQSENPGNTFNFPWAPDASYFGGRFHLYSSFSAFFGQNKSCITHLSTTDPASGDWTDHGPVVCTDGTQDYNAIDADVGVDAAGDPWLSFGSFWGGIHAFPLDAEGARVGNELTRLAWAEEIEAPVLFRRCGYYYLFVTWGLCCPGEGRSVDDLTYRVAVGRSENILGPYLDRDGIAMLDGGGTLVVEGDGVDFAAAGHSDVIASGEKIYHLYHAYRQSNGNAELRIVELPFDDEGWPVPGGP